jgi:hypothetical protein
VRRWQDHLPLYRLEQVYAREGLDLARSTMCGWHADLAVLVHPLIEAMWQDALASPYLCTDATGVWRRRRSGAARGTSGCSSRRVGMCSIATRPDTMQAPSTQCSPATREKACGVDETYLLRAAHTALANRSLTLLPHDLRQ